MQLKIIQHGSPEFDSAVALRDRVLRRPLGLRFTAQQLAAESTCVHVAGVLNERFVAACVIAPVEDGCFKIRQVAVDFDFQRMGLGRQLMEFVHHHVDAMGGTKVFCHARDVAVPFYLKLGYRTVGGYFEEVSIQHIRMEKDLRPTDNSRTLDE